MAHFTKIWPAGLVDNVSKIAHGDLETLDANASKAINGDDGGAWSPSSAISVAGAGLARTIKSGVWDNFNADPGGKRTVSRRSSFTPALRVFVGGSVTSWGIAQGAGLGAVLSAVLLAPPDNATLTKLRVYVKIATGRAALPDTMPSVDVQRVLLDGSNPLGESLRSAAAPAYFPRPANVAGYELATTQFWDFTPDQFATLDRTSYAYRVDLFDESGNNAMGGNLFYGYEATFTLADWRP